MAQNTVADTTVPQFRFTYDDSLSSFSVTQRDWFRVNDKHWDGLASSAIIFKNHESDEHTNRVEKVLLVQRAAHDSSPNKWEAPGGAVDWTDASVLEGCAREVWEEAGLQIKHFSCVLNEGEDVQPGFVFTNSKGTKLYCKFTFLAEAEDQQVVISNEHQDWLWASKKDIEERKVEGKVIALTGKAQYNVIMEAFRVKEKLGG